jgi:hypothetical protein
MMDSPQNNPINRGVAIAIAVVVAIIALLVMKARYTRDEGASAACATRALGRGGPCAECCYAHGAASYGRGPGGSCECLRHK